ncbi:MAG: choice-of-anchor B family protein [Bacteroidetes bacterium]|nr:choice-of-anchor B family protein [Bacteroidota bacterium]
MKYFFICLSFLYVSKITSQTYAASNFTLISLISPEVGVNGYGDKYSGSWGWYQANLNKEYAIACSKSGTYWVDVTNPFTPTVSAYSAGTSTNGVWRETKTYQNYCYVVSDDAGTNSFQIFDMSNLPTSVNKVYDSQALFKRGHALYVDGNKLYVSSVTYSNNATSSLDVYSLANPAAPVLLRQLKQDYNFITSVHDMFARNDTVFASCGNQGMYIFKFNTGLNTFTQLGSITTYTGSGYNHSSALTPNGQTLVFTDEVPTGLPIKTANVSNLSNIQILATTNQFTQTTPHNPFIVSNQYVFLSSYQDGTQLYDISNPSSPVLAGFFDTFPAGGGNNNNWSGDNYDGQWGCYPFFPSKNIFACDQKNGLFMLKTHLYQNPIAAGTPTVSFISQGTLCLGSSTTLTNTSTGATSYTWTFSGGIPSTSTLTNPSVTYSTTGIKNILLSASNASGTSTSSGTVSVKQVQATVSFTNATCSTCNDGAASVMASAGSSPYSYTWMPNGSNAALANNLSPACYTVSIKDAIGCSATKTVCISFSSGIENNSLMSSTLKIYPNPAQSKITIELPESIFNYRLINPLGMVLCKSNNNINATEIDLSQNSRGIYFLEIESGNDRITKKIMVE